MYDAGSWAVFTNIYQNLLTFEPGSPTPKPDAAESCEFTSPQNAFERMLHRRRREGVPVGEREAVTEFAPVRGECGARLREEKSVSGSGPYVIASYTAEKSITLRPNTAYKGAGTKRGVAVEVHYFETSRHVEEAWNARTFDIAYAGLPAATLAGIDPSDEDVRLSAGDSAEAHYLVLNMRSPDKALGRAETRRALASLIDRGRLAGEVFEHTVTPLYSLVPQGVVGHSTAFFDRYPEADAAYAAGRLRSAGITTPVRIKLGHQNGIAWWGPAMSSAAATHRPRSTTPSGTPSGSPITARPCSGSGRSRTRSRRTLP